MKKSFLLFITIFSLLISNISYYKEEPIILAREEKKVAMANVKEEKIKVEKMSSNESTEVLIENSKEETLKVEEKSSSKSTKVNKTVEKKSVEPKKAKTFLEQIKERNDVLGTLGRIYLPTINLNVAVYYANVSAGEGYNAQTIVDRKDSAAYFSLGNKAIIADHNYQGFNKLLSLKVGADAYIKNNDGTISTYKLTNKFVGKNTAQDLVDSKGNSVQNMDGDLIMYTCYTSDVDVMITLWKKMN